MRLLMPLLVFAFAQSVIEEVNNLQCALLFHKKRVNSVCCEFSLAPAPIIDLAFK